jgi:hypothetical protein
MDGIFGRGLLCELRTLIYSRKGRKDWMESVKAKGVAKGG